MGATARQFVEAMLDARRPESAPISNENLCLLYLAKVHDALAESVAALEEGRRICIECDINSAAVEDCAAMMGEVNAVKADLERVTKERDEHKAQLAERIE